MNNMFNIKDDLSLNNNTPFDWIKKLECFLKNVLGTEYYDRC